jgi:hypothetical protein
MMTTVVASAAAQDSTAPQVPVSIQTEQAVQNFAAAEPSGQVRNLNSTLAISKGFGFDSAVVRQGSGQKATVILLAGLTNWGGAGFAVGGGVWLENFTGNEHFILEIDGSWSPTGGGVAGFSGEGFSANLIQFGAAFLYKFKEMSSGWIPFVGGGIYYARVSFSYDQSFLCDFAGIDLCSSSYSSTDFLVKGGLYKGKIGFEGRAGNGFESIFFLYRLAK